MSVTDATPQPNYIMCIYIYNSLADRVLQLLKTGLIAEVLRGYSLLRNTNAMALSKHVGMALQITAWGARELIHALRCRLQD